MQLSPLRDAQHSLRYLVINSAVKIDFLELPLIERGTLRKIFFACLPFVRVCAMHVLCLLM